MSCAAVTFHDLSVLPCLENRDPSYLLDQTSPTTTTSVKKPSKEGAVFNDEIDFEPSTVNTVALEREKNIDFEREIINQQLLKQIINIEIIGNEWSDENIKGPNEFVIAYAKGLIPQMVVNDLIPFRVTQSIEEGISFVFKNDNKLFYLEIYNDNEIGILIEDYYNKIILKNKELQNYEEIFDELNNFF